MSHRIFHIDLRLPRVHQYLADHPETKCLMSPDGGTLIALKSPYRKEDFLKGRIPATEIVALPAEYRGVQPVEPVIVPLACPPEARARYALCEKCPEYAGSKCGLIKCSAEFINNLRRGKCPKDLFKELNHGQEIDF